MAVEPTRWYFSLRSPYSWLAYRELTENAPTWRNGSSGALLGAGRGERPAPGRDGHPAALRPDVEGEAPLHPAGRQAARRRARPRRRLAGGHRARLGRLHLGYLVAEDAGLGREFIGLAYRARFERGLDLSERAVVAAIGTELGLDPDTLGNAADDPAVLARGVEALRTIGRDGVFGVPFFVHGPDRYWGSDRLNGFLAGVRAAA
ncbi:DsbA family protein [Kitasatospora aburaviensis]